MEEVKRSASLLALLLFLSLVLVIFPQIAPVNAEGTIYIRADGSVEGTDEILRDGNLYTFTSDIYGPIVVEKDDVVIDGAGYTLEGNEENMGINLNERSGVKIKNINFLNWWCGIANFGNNCTRGVHN